MFSKFTLGAAAAAVAVTAMPAVASAQYRDGYRDYRYEQTYRGDRYRRGDNVYARNQGGYYGQSYGNNYYGARRCKGTTGTIVGGVAGALVGREVTRNSGRSFRRGGNGTVGAIIGGAIGALAGRAVDKSSCNNRGYNDRNYYNRGYGY